MIVSTLDCVNHGRQGVISLYFSTPFFGSWWVQYDNGEECRNSGEVVDAYQCRVPECIQWLTITAPR